MSKIIWANYDKDDYEQMCVCGHKLYEHASTLQGWDGEGNSRLRVSQCAMECSCKEFKRTTK